MPARNRQRRAPCHGARSSARAGKAPTRRAGGVARRCETGAGAVLWQELTSPEIAALDRERTVIVLPVGSVEQHGNHMPLGTDTMLAVAVAEAAAGKAAAPSGVLPPPWYGFSAHHMRFPGTVTLRPETMMALVEDIVASVVAHGFGGILIVNGHGGNGGVIDVLASKLGHRFYGSARIACLTYFQLARDEIAALRESEPGGMGHACEFETSLIMHLRPDLVHQERAAVCYPDPGSAYLTTDLLGGSAVRTYHDFGDLSASGTLGDPSPCQRRRRARASSPPSSTRSPPSSRISRTGRSRRRAHDRTAAGRRDRPRLSSASATPASITQLPTPNSSPSATAIAEPRRRNCRRPPAPTPIADFRRRCSRVPTSTRSASACRTASIPTRPSPRPRPARRSCSKSRSPMMPRMRGGSSMRSRRTASA